MVPKIFSGTIFCLEGFNERFVIPAQAGIVMQYINS